MVSNRVLFNKVQKELKFLRGNGQECSVIKFYLTTKNLENSYSIRWPPFAIDFRKFLPQITIRTLNSKTTLKYLIGLWVLILEVVFITEVSISFYIIITV